jgi:cytochrome c-type biogenesis protein CcmH/NrfF
MRADRVLLWALPLIITVSGLLVAMVVTAVLRGC